jgi:hypothetical protein
MKGNVAVRINYAFQPMVWPRWLHALFVEDAALKISTAARFVFPVGQSLSGVHGRISMSNRILFTVQGLGFRVQGQPFTHRR